METTAKPPLKERLAALLKEFGMIAVVIWFSIFVLVFVGAAIAISAGVKVESATGTASVMGAAYLATQALKPVRILATLVLTPILGGLYRRLRKPPTPAA